jgi:YidC/Oxa1 family membrane protein insertase
MDIKRSVLWVIFVVSLVMLFDNWQRHTGHQSMFFPGARRRYQQRVLRRVRHDAGRT